jgi:hypothetical protein
MGRKKGRQPDAEKYSQRIKSIWKEGGYDNRNETYRTSQGYIAKVSKNAKKQWETGVFTEERNKKISDAHKGKSKPWLRKIRVHYYKICEFCNETFRTVSYGRRFCSKLCSNRFGGLHREPLSREKKKIQGEKISRALKGKIPKNILEQGFVNCNNNYKQNEMYYKILNYFPCAIPNFRVKTNRSCRWLDVSIPIYSIDFEYDGKIHLRRDVQEGDRIREHELKEMGWDIIRFNNGNFQRIDQILIRTVLCVKLLLSMNCVDTFKIMGGNHD